MHKLEIKGGKRISGTIVISGSKNATLPILASTILTKKKVVITNVPIVKDVETMVNLLSAIGSTIKFNKNDAILFGSESNGLSESIFNKLQKENVFTIPMKPNNRSLNLSNAVSIIVYESWKQHNFEGSV